MKKLKSNSVGLGASSSKKTVTGKNLRIYIDGKEIPVVNITSATYINMPSTRHQRLFLFLATLGLQAPRWWLPVGVNASSGVITLDVMHDQLNEI